VLHCKTVEGVEKELTMYALVYNLIRLVMLEGSRRQGVAVERISFADAARWLCQAISTPPFWETASALGRGFFIPWGAMLPRHTAMPLNAPLRKSSTEQRVD